MKKLLLTLLFLGISGGAFAFGWRDAVPRFLGDLIREEPEIISGPRCHQAEVRSLRPDPVISRESCTRTICEGNFWGKSAIDACHEPGQRSEMRGDERECWTVFHLRFPERARSEKPWTEVRFPAPCEEEEPASSSGDFRWDLFSGLIPPLFADEDERQGVDWTYEERIVGANLMGLSADLIQAPMNLESHEVIGAPGTNFRNLSEMALLSGRFLYYALSPSAQSCPHLAMQSLCDLARPYFPVFGELSRSTALGQTEDLNRVRLDPGFRFLTGHPWFVPLISSVLAHEGGHQLYHWWVDTGGGDQEEGVVRVYPLFVANVSPVDRLEDEVVACAVGSIVFSLQLALVPQGLEISLTRPLYEVANFQLATYQSLRADPTGDQFILAVAPRVMYKYAYQILSPYIHLDDLRRLRGSPLWDNSCEGHDPETCEYTTCRYKYYRDPDRVIREANTSGVSPVEQSDYRESPLDWDQAFKEGFGMCLLRDPDLMSSVGIPAFQTVIDRLRRRGGFNIPTLSGLDQQLPSRLRQPDTDHDHAASPDVDEENEEGAPPDEGSEEPPPEERADRQGSSESEGEREPDMTVCVLDLIEGISTDSDPECINWCWEAFPHGAPEDHWLCGHAQEEDLSNGCRYSDNGMCEEEREKREQNEREECYDHPMRENCIELCDAVTGDASLKSEEWRFCEGICREDPQASLYCDRRCYAEDGDFWGCIELCAADPGSDYCASICNRRNGSYEFCEPICSEEAYRDEPWCERWHNSESGGTGGGSSGLTCLSGWHDEFGEVLWMQEYGLSLQENLELSEDISDGEFRNELYAVIAAATEETQTRIGECDRYIGSVRCCRFPSRGIDVCVPQGDNEACEVGGFCGCPIHWGRDDPYWPPFTGICTRGDTRATGNYCCYIDTSATILCSCMERRLCP